MKLSAFFLGTKRIAANGSTAGKGQTLLDQDDDDDEGSETTLVYQLARASELAINDEPAGAFSCRFLASLPFSDLCVADQSRAMQLSRLSKATSSHARWKTPSRLLPSSSAHSESRD